MLRPRHTIAVLAVGAAACLLAACQSTSTAGLYRSGNCAMVGSSCSRD